MASAILAMETSASPLPSLRSVTSMMSGSLACVIASALEGLSWMTPSWLTGTFVSPLNRAASARM